MKDSLTKIQSISGAWGEVSPCKNCHSIVFTKETMVFSYLPTALKETLNYTWLLEDSIQVKRNLNGKSVETKHKVIIHKDGIVELKNFVQGFEAFPGRYEGDVSHFHSIFIKKEK